MTVMDEAAVQYVADEQGRVTGVIVPIELWEDLLAEMETHYLLQSEAMRQQLLAAKARSGGMALEAVVNQFEWDR